MKNRRTIHRVPFWTAGLILIGPFLIHSQADSPPSVGNADALSVETLNRWDNLYYNLGKQGVVSGGFTLEVSIQNPFGPQKGTGWYSWNGDEGNLQWSNAQVGAMIEQQGWTKELFDGFFETSPLVERFSANVLKGVEKKDRIVILVSGENGQRVRSLTFTPNGILQGVTLSAPDPQGSELELSIGFSFDRTGSYYQLKGWKLEMDLPGMGKMVEATELQREMAGSFSIIRQASSKTWIDGKPAGEKTVRFDHWKLKTEDQ